MTTMTKRAAIGRQRRSFLRAVGATAAALPFYRLLESSAVQAADAPLRFVGVYAPHGIAAPLFGRRPGETETSYDLKFADSVLAPFDDAATYGRSFKDKIITIEGLDLTAGIEKGVTGHSAPCVIFTGAPQTGGVAHESIDQYLAVTKGLGSATRLSSLILSVGNKDTDQGTAISWSKGGAPLPKLFDPVETWSRVFGDAIIGTDPAAQAAAERKRAAGKSVLDFIRNDIGRLHKRLAAPEGVKLDQHLTSLRELEKQLEAFRPAAACALPGKPAALPKLLMYNGGEPYFDKITDLQIDLLVQAIGCDQTRFVTLFMNDLSRTKFDPSLPEDCHAGVAHQYDGPHDSNYGSGVYAGKPDSWRLLGKQNRYCFGKSARLLQKLTEVGALDSTVVYISSDMGDPALHSSRNVPTILAGGANGKLKTGRRVVLQNDCPPDRYHCGAPDLKMVPNNRVLVSLCQLFGVQTNAFGASANATTVTGALPELA